MSLRESLPIIVFCRSVPIHRRGSEFSAISRYKFHFVMLPVHASLLRIFFSFFFFASANFFPLPFGHVFCQLKSNSRKREIGTIICICIYIYIEIIEIEISMLRIFLSRR